MYLSLYIYTYLSGKPNSEVIYVHLFHSQGNKCKDVHTTKNLQTLEENQLHQKDMSNYFETTVKLQIT